jgi:hypothetical protein
VAWERPQEGHDIRDKEHTYIQGRYGRVFRKLCRSPFRNVLRVCIEIVDTDMHSEARTASLADGMFPVAELAGP